MSNEPISSVVKPRPPRALVPALVGLVLVLVAAISFMIGRATAPTSSVATVPSNESNQAASAPKAQAPQKEFAKPIQDAATRKKALEIPRRKEGDPLALGPVDAPVVMTMWEDFTCPMCTRFELSSFPEIKKLAEAGKIRIEWRDNTIFAQSHRSDLAAIGARAAGRQGKFWDYVRVAYETAGEGNHPSYDDNLVLRIAKQAGVADIEKFQKDFKDPKLAEEVKADTFETQQLGISGTPAFLINDSFISGAYPTDYFLNTINDRLANSAK
ncbi:DsbA family protein [Actinomycetaceae bacterium TAE3-ERU4]|nr:DsbA family protein [Actinomycetaceae bacterium TAE3-ERU4]